MDLGEHVESYEAGEAEGGGLVEVGKEDGDEAEDVHRVHILQLVVEMLQMGLCQDDLG